ncbi:LacI family DNA-binding transcriptional regulator [Aquamicrobium sp. LC103]|uniref:LacI family DNA-binding transcriptional regulator n=1 Tax=Aquamicrobium sp. LC103 TaxID=1120658 RepID=UPI00063E85A7|nr:LacI family DNA-binding transcriptional regulator [Aquamicrobium sp. LC103]
MDREKKKIRSFEVAELAQISRSTVSRALAGDPRISEDTRERVLAAAAELGYQPNLIARGLKNQSTGIVGVVVTDLNNPYHAHALQLLIEKLGARRLAPLVFVGDTAEGAESAIERLMSYQVDAVIALAAPFSSQIVRACKAGRKPLVLMNRYDGDETVNVICGDSISAGAMVADHLVGQGARTFAYFAGEDSTTISLDRETGFVKRLNENGFALSARVSSRYSHAHALKVAPELLSSGAQAVFCANDTLAFALIDAVRQSPAAAVSPLIVGYDNSALASWPIYDLTSVDQNLEEMTSLTVETAHAIVIASDTPPKRHTIKPYLVERGSTRIQSA